MFPILQHPPQSSRLPYSEGQKCDPSSNKGATVTKDGKGEKSVWKEEEEESEKEETAWQEAVGTKNNKKWPSSCLKMGKHFTSTKKKKSLKKKHLLLLSRVSRHRKGVMSAGKSSILLHETLHILKCLSAHSAFTLRRTCSVLFAHTKALQKRVRHEGR